MLDGKTTRRALLAAAPFAMAGAAFSQEEPEVAYLLDTGLDAFGRPIARAMIDGKGPFRFLVDTGATTTVVTMDLAIALGLTFQGMTTIYGTTGSAVMPVARASEFEVGSVRKQNLRMVAMTHPLGARADGIIGADVFVGRRVVFDLNRKTVKISNSRGQRSVRADTTFRLRDGRLAEVRGTIGRAKAGVIIDTGADCCLINPPLREELRIAHPKMRTVERVIVTGLTGQVLEGEGLYLPEISMRGLDINSVIAVSVDAPVFHVWKLNEEPAMIMGADVLMRLPKFSIDYGAAAFDVGPLALLPRALQGAWA
jgi:predicted aspartyl protease